MDKKKHAVGMLDSGVGGLTVVREVIKTMPAEKIIYFGDTLHLPYGPKSKKEVKNYVYKIIDYFISRNVKTIILACNTATSMLLEETRKKVNLPLFGTIDGVAQSVRNKTKNNKIGVIGTKGTINSRAYQKALINESSKFEIFARACPEFVGLVEEGKFNGPEVENVIKKHLLFLKEKNIDTLILGCTHYPYLIPVIKKIMGDEVKLINPAKTMAVKAKNIMAVKGMISDKDENPIDFNEHEFYVSDIQKISIDFLNKGTNFLELPHLSFKELDIFKENKEIINS